MQRALALAAVLAAVGLMIVGQPGSAERLDRIEPEFDRALKAREPHIDPGELLALMYNNQNLLIVIDARDEANFNLFHLEDAIWRPIEAMTDACCRKLAIHGVKVVLSNDEARAERAYKHLMSNGVTNVYILAGGINGWLDLFKDGKTLPPLDELNSGGDDLLRHPIDAALGHHHPWSLPDPKLLGRREFPEKVKVLRPVDVEGGGCG